MFRLHSRSARQVAARHRQVACATHTDEIELAQLRRLHETLPLEIVAVLESLNRLRESPDYELCQISEQKPGVLEELAAERAALLVQESAELEEQARRLAAEIKELGGAEGAGK